MCRVGRDRLHADAEAVHRGARRRVRPVGVARGVARGDLRSVVEWLELDVERLADAALPRHLHLDHVARPAEADHLLQLADVLDRLAVHRHDDIAGLDAGGLGRRVVARDVLDHDPADLGQPDVSRVVQVDVVDGDAQRRPVHLAVGDELVHDGTGEVDRDGEAVARVESGLAGDGGVDADHLAADAHERAAGVAGVDGRVGLDEVLDAALAPARQAAQRASLGADDAGGDGEGEALAERIADGQDPFTDPRVFAVAERHRRERPGIDLQHGHVGVGIGADDLGLELPPIEQPDDDLLGPFDDMVVGQDVAVRRDDEPGAAALLDLRLLAEPGREEALHARRDVRLLGGVLGSLRPDVDHAGLHMLRHCGEGFAEVPQRTGRRYRGRRHGSDGRGLPFLFLRRGADRQIEEPGEQQPEGECQGHQATELEPVQRSCGHRAILRQGVVIGRHGPA